MEATNNKETDFQLNYKNMGFDTQGQQYESIDEMWKQEVEGEKSSLFNKVGTKQDWYEKGEKYWEKVPATVDGVLGGLGHLDNLDIKDSKKFFEKMRSQNIVKDWNRCLDVGAGIGRITTGQLSKLFTHSDLLEQNQAYIDKAKEILGQNHKGEFYTAGCQDFVYTQKYDVIWIQWVIGHLTDKDCVEYLRKSKLALAEGGVIIMKENISSGCFIIDKEDCTIIRDEMYFKTIFEQTGLNIIYEEDFEEFPKDLYRITTYVLK